MPGILRFMGLSKQRSENAHICFVYQLGVVTVNKRRFPVHNIYIYTRVYYIHFCSFGKGNLRMSQDGALANAARSRPEISPVMLNWSPFANVQRKV